MIVFVVNSKEKIVALARNKGALKIFEHSGESRALWEIPKEEHASEWDVVAMNIDADDNIYPITTFQQNDEQIWSVKLSIFDKNGNEKLQSAYLFFKVLITRCAWQ